MNQRSLSGYSLKMKEVEQMSRKRLEKDRQHSQRHYESLRHKIDDEENNSKRSSGLRRQEEEAVVKSLSSFERKMSRGVSNAEKRKRET